MDEPQSNYWLGNLVYEAGLFVRRFMIKLLTKYCISKHKMGILVQNDWHLMGVAPVGIATLVEIPFHCRISGGYIIYRTSQWGL